MFDTTWKDSRRYVAESDIAETTTRLLPERVECVALLHWREHCLECAPPTCYRMCPKYKRRIDRKCIRMTYGFAENFKASGLFPYGADCRFEPWANVECRFNPARYAPRAIRRLDYVSRSLSRGVLSFSKGIKFISPTLKVSGALNALREWSLLRKGKDIIPLFDAFVLECHSTESESFKLQLQCDHDGTVLFRRSFDIAPGQNYYEIPFGDFNISPMTPNARIFLYPENDLPCRLIFTWLDFVRYAQRPVEASPAAEKVKCIAWDLDNTLWKGILIEDGPNGVQLNQEAVNIILQLDQRGIIHTIVSKNTHKEAHSLLEKLGISDYFIYPAINWGAKSENLKQVASRINIGLDAFAFVDDSPQEREEVSSRLPMVRTYTEKQIVKLPDLPEFDMPTTEASSQRRLSYLTEMKREEIEASFGDNYEGFLRGLNMHMEIFHPTTESEKTRCVELLQRSNQLNISTHRYTAEEFSDLLASKNMLCYAFRCKDKFGDYGIVGFISIALERVPRIQDMVISCRISQKHFEYALIHWISQRLAHDGYHEMLAKLVKTKRNGPLVEVFKGLPFEAAEENEQSIVYKLPDLGMVKDENIITTTFRGRG
ncbi:MAG: HAD-IIIC family phosphatase [Nitrospirota bacterium]